MKIITVFLLCIVIGSTEAWIPAAQSIQIPKPTTSKTLSWPKIWSRTRLLSTEEGHDDSDKTNPRKFGVRRIGGRKQRKLAKGSEGKQGFPFWVFAASILSVFLLKGAYDFGFDSSFVYYESTVYESRVYNSDGRVETSRKESVRSNIPSLAERRQQKQLPSPEDEVIREMEQMMLRQEAILEQLF